MKKIITYFVIGVLLFLLPFLAFSQDNRELSSWKAENGKYGFRTWQGLWAVKPIYDQVLEFYDQRHTWVRMGGLWGLINRKGVYIIHCKYHKLMDTFDTENFVCVQKDSKYGCVNMVTGKEIIPCLYDVPFSFEKVYGVGFVARLVQNKKVGLLDSTGRAVIACLYDNRWDNTFEFHPETNCFLVEQNKKKGIITIEGAVVVPCEFSVIEIVMNKDNTFFAYTQKGKKHGAYHSKKQEIVPCVYDTYFEFDKKGLAVVQKNKKYLIIDSKGQELTIPTKDSYEVDSLLEEISKDK